MVNVDEERCVMCGKTIPEGRMVCPICEDMEPSFETIKVTVLLNKITDIKEFVNLASMCQGDVAVKSGNFAVDAKSLMGLFSLDLTRPLSVEFYGRVPYDVANGMKKFIVD